jgi:hypothetical protein
MNVMFAAFRRWVTTWRGPSAPRAVWPASPNTFFSIFILFFFILLCMCVFAACRRLVTTLRGPSAPKGGAACFPKYIFFLPIPLYFLYSHVYVCVCSLQTLGHNLARAFRSQGSVPCGLSGPLLPARGQHVPWLFDVFAAENNTKVI